MSLPRRMIGFFIAIVVIAAGVALVAGGWFASSGGRQVAKETPAGRLPVDRSAVDEKIASQPQPQPAVREVSGDAKRDRSPEAENGDEKPAAKIPLAKLPGFGKPAKSPDKADTGNLIRSGEASVNTGKTGESGKTGAIVTGSVGKVEHLYKPAPPLEVERKKAEASIKSEEDTVKIVTGFECSTPLEIEKISPTHFRVKITTESTLRNWFMFRVEGAKGKTVRIDIKDAPLNKWWSLNPVWSSLASIDDPATFHKVTSDKKYPAKQAYNGPMLPDTSEQNWHYISDIWMEDQRLDRTGTFCFVSTYESDGVFLAMRAPYTVKYNEAYVKSLEGKAGVKVIEVGRSKEDRPLQVVQIGSGDPKQTPCIVMYAREHGSEHDSSWVVKGAIDWMTRDDAEARQMRERISFIAIPILDVDAAAAGIYESITQHFFYNGKEGPEARANAGFFRNWVDRDGRLELVLDLHNVESSEGPHIFCPILELDSARNGVSLNYHARLMKDLIESGYEVTHKPLGARSAHFRLGGYLALMYGPIFIPYEVNSQHSLRHLSVEQLRKMGHMMVRGASAFCTEEPNLLANVVQPRLADRNERMRRFEARYVSNGVTNALQIEWGSRSDAAAARMGNQGN